MRLLKIRFDHLSLPLFVKSWYKALRWQRFLTSQLLQVVSTIKCIEFIKADQKTIHHVYANGRKMLGMPIKVV